MKRTWDQMCEMLEEQAKEIEKLNKLLLIEQISNQGKQEETERLREALEFYADEDIWSDMIETYNGLRPIWNDNGETAREALKED